MTNVHAQLAFATIAQAALETLQNQRDHMEKHLYNARQADRMFAETFANAIPVYTAAFELFSNLEMTFVGEVIMKATKDNIERAGYKKTGVKARIGGQITPIITAACVMMEREYFGQEEYLNENLTGSIGFRVLMNRGQAVAIFKNKVTEIMMKLHAL